MFNHSLVWAHFGHKKGHKVATIRKRLNGRWQVLIRRKGFPKQSKVFKSKADANQWVRWLQMKIYL